MVYYIDMESLAGSKKESWLPWFLKGILILGFLFLLGRLVELQIIKGQHYRNLAEENRIKRIVIKAPRGRILARGGEVLVGNTEINESSNFTGRYYPLGEKFAHLGGYLGEVSDKEIGKINPKCPEKGPMKIGDFIGRSGLEQEYECLLAGINGEELVEVDTAGKTVRVLGKKEPIPGHDLKTSINFGLQEKVATLFSGKKGAVIVTDPKGEILALYSAPSFDPNLFLNKDKTGQVAKLLTDESLPLFNRTIGGLFHPGSVFKPVVAIAALSEGAINENYIFNDPGVITIDKYSYSNWYFSQYGRTEGEIGLVRAIARSTDTFFYKIGELTGIDALTKWADAFGFNQESGIDLPGEMAGLVPTPEWKKKVKGELWFLGNTYHFSIGQGDLAVTPIEENRAISAIASRGKLCSPKISGEEKCNDLKIKKEFLDLVIKGMVAACSEGGTGYTFFDFKPQVACKTGTAETNQDGKTHAWFTVFAPVDSPEIVATVLVERGGEGSSVAGPIAREIFDYWFNP